MKRCPECRRDYSDETLNYCLDDGSPLLDGPASADEPATAIFSPTPASEPRAHLFNSADLNQNPVAVQTTSSNRHYVIAGAFGVILLAALVVSYVYYGKLASKQIE